MEKLKLSEVNLQEAELTELSNEQLANTDGGIIPLLLNVAAAYGGLLALSYAAGAAYGYLTKD
ncbi:class IIb bacteriocin, lactobin A/cerein 7B family [Ohtaekwangia koreensis]|uniref:Class IIb bacteriocin, lactobin A/cerein 7B family n=1 Tax=Ohtaekwangia koreensis TaxID=688867 RepID=A0A1T5ITM8_9BACT|nr:class IIb bacteriocin, lactobin A/cerein 7B family [Ohtaekwangia koreensis]SKC42537.1 class IIb bacteriocin, lactobin A/cerein 7B family [Ohtaekwangia koreensis]